ncbi:hypothetical protein ACFDR9_001412 [Janthinobacterium sp. CG_23.3]
MPGDCPLARPAAGLAYSGAQPAESNLRPTAQSAGGLFVTDRRLDRRSRRRRRRCRAARPVDNSGGDTFKNTLQINGLCALNHGQATCVRWRISTSYFWSFPMFLLYTLEQNGMRVIAGPPPPSVPLSTSTLLAIWAIAGNWSGAGSALVVLEAGVVLLRGAGHAQLQFVAALDLRLRLLRVELAAAGAVAGVARQQHPLAGAQRGGVLGFQFGAEAGLGQALVVALVAQVARFSSSVPRCALAWRRSDGRDRPNGLSNVHVTPHSQAVRGTKVEHQFALLVRFYLRRNIKHFPPARLGARLTRSCAKLSVWLHRSA